MPAFTGNQLVSRAKTAADMRDNFVTPAEFLTWLNVEVQNLDILTARAGWVLRATLTETFAAPQSSFTLSQNALAVIGVYEYDQGKYRRIPLGHIIDFQRDDNEQPGTPVFYTATADGDTTTIKLHPRTVSSNIAVVYLPVKTPLVALSSSAGAFPLGFEEWIVLKLAIRALVKEESETSGLEKLLAAQESAIEQACWARVQSDVGKIRNVDLSERGWSFYPVFPQVDSWAWL